MPKGISETKGLLDGLPQTLPALSQAQEIQDRAARVGFDWDSIAPVWEKVMEELKEVEDAKNPKEKADELGDLLFAVVNLSRWNKTDAETALREANRRFRTRFKYIEQHAHDAGTRLADMSLAEKDK